MHVSLPEKGRGMEWIASKEMSRLGLILACLTTLSLVGAGQTMPGMANELSAAELNSLGQSETDSSRLKARALYNQAEFSLAGFGVSQSLKRARELMAQAAALGEPEAEYQYGLMLEYGAGEPADQAAAAAWYRRAAEQDEVNAQLALGRLLAHTAPGNVHEARYWLEKAARRANAKAQFELFLLLSRPEATRADLAQADRALAEAATALDRAQIVQQAIHERRKAGMPVTPTALAEAWAKGAASGDVKSAWLDALACTYGIGRSIDPVAAKVHLTRLAASGHAEAAYYLFALESGDGEWIPLASSAIDWLQQAAKGGYPQAVIDLDERAGTHGVVSPQLRKAAASGLPQAEFDLAVRLSESPGGRAEAEGWLLQAAKQGHVGAAYTLALESKQLRDASRLQWLRLAAERGLEQAQEAYANALLRAGEAARAQAASWLERAFENGDHDAALRLGDLYARDEAAPQNTAKAFNWYLKAAQRGLDHSLNGLCSLIGKPGAQHLAWSSVRHLLEQEVIHGAYAYRYQLGELARNGLGEPQDFVKARRLFQQVVEGPPSYTMADAMAALGDLDAEGRGGPRDDQAAFRWYTQATQQRSVGADHAVCMRALMIRDGRGTPADPAKGLEMLKTTVNNPEAAYRLGLILEHGDRTPVDLPEARKQLAWAATSGWPAARDELFNFKGHDTHYTLVNGHTFWTALQRRAAADDRQAALELGTGALDRALDRQDVERGLYWLKRAAKMGSVSAMRQLSAFYELGTSTISGPSNLIFGDRAQSDAWMLEAARHGDHGAQSNIAGRLLDQKPPKPREAFHWAREAVKGGAAEAYATLGGMYEEGHGTPADGHQALRCYEEAVRRGNLISCETIAGMYEAGRVLPRNLKQAFAWRLKGAMANEEICEEALAKMYEQGQGTPRDLQSAIRWYAKSFRTTDNAPAYAIARIYATGPREIQNSTLALEWYLKGLAYEPEDDDAIRKFDEDNFSGFRDRFGELGAARFHLAQCFEEGIGVKRDPTEALEWYDSAAGTDGLPSAQDFQANLKVAVAADLGQGMASDAKRALEGYHACENLVPSCFENPFEALTDTDLGDDLGASLAPVVMGLQQAAEAGYAPAQYELAWLYLRGFGVPPQPELASRWMRKASAQGYLPAIFSEGSASSSDSEQEDNDSTGQSAHPLAFYQRIRPWLLKAAEPSALANAGRGERIPTAYSQAILAFDTLCQARHLGKYRSKGILN